MRDPEELQADPEHAQPSHDAVPELEVDEDVAPRPEEEVADAGRDDV